MLSAKRRSDGTTVLAYSASKRDSPFSCSVCGDPVVLKIGNSRINHFAHENPLTCLYSRGESDLHRRCKTEIYDALVRTPGVKDVAMERALGTVRPDVSAYIRGIPVAIEVQISALPIETILQRTIEYHRKGIYVLWLLQWTPDLDQDRYAPQPWEKWVHTVYFGRVYYWTRDLEVVSYRFEPKLKSIPKKTWYSKAGILMKGGGYTRRLKRSRVPVRGETFNLATDFVPRERSWWGEGKFKVPDAKLFMEPFKRLPSDLSGEMAA